MKRLLLLITSLIVGISYVSTAKELPTFSQMIQNMLNDNFQIMYFVQTGCVPCEEEMPQIEKLQSLGFKVYIINANNHPNTVIKWKVWGTPTTIFVSPKLKKAISISAPISYTRMIFYVYDRVYK